MDGENLKEGSLKISFLNKDYGTNVDFGDFEYNLSVEDLDIGNYPIVIAVGDKYKNYADTLVQLIVLPIATRVENRLESDKKKYLINKKIELKPGETLSIELSKEVPYGFYDIILPQTQEIMQQSQEENATEPQEEANVIKAVEISDKRPVYKKIGSGLGIVTGSVVRAGGYIASRPLLASVILIVIVLLIVGYYGRGFLMDRIKGRKSRDTSQLFKNFKYKEEKEEK